MVEIAWVEFIACDDAIVDLDAELSGKKRTAQLKAMVAAAWKKLPEKPAPKGRVQSPFRASQPTVGEGQPSFSLNFLEGALAT